MKRKEYFVVAYFEARNDLNDVDYDLRYWGKEHHSYLIDDDDLREMKAERHNAKERIRKYQKEIEPRNLWEC